MREIDLISKPINFGDMFVYPFLPKYEILVESRYY